MYDIHTHLYWESYDADRDEVILRAREAGVEKMFVIGCTVEESKQSVALAEKYGELFASVGVHPHEINNLVQIPDTKYLIPNQSQNNQISEWVQSLKEIAQSSDKVIAIGECGLDYYSHDKSKNTSDEQKVLQKEGFLAQIELAKELNLPLIIHCRPSIGAQDAYEDMFEILNSKILNLKSAVLHCYMGDTEVTKKFLMLPNIYFSFTANITYPVKKVLIGTKDDLTETVKIIPLDRIFAETDCPFLSPQGKRGERNEPAFVLETIEKVAFLKGITVDLLEKMTEENASQIFMIE